MHIGHRKGLTKFQSNPYLRIVENVVRLLLSGLQMCGGGGCSGRRRVVLVVKVRMGRQGTVRCRRHRDVLPSAVHCNYNHARCDDVPLVNFPIKADLKNQLFINGRLP